MDWGTELWVSKRAARSPGRSPWKLPRSRFPGLSLPLVPFSFHVPPLGLHAPTQGKACPFISRPPESLDLVLFAKQRLSSLLSPPPPPKASKLLSTVSTRSHLSLNRRSSQGGPAAHPGPRPFSALATLDLFSPSLASKSKGWFWNGNRG